MKGRKSRIVHKFCAISLLKLLSYCTRFVSLPYVMFKLLLYYLKNTESRKYFKIFQERNALNLNCRLDNFS